MLLAEEIACSTKMREAMEAAEQARRARIESKLTKLLEEQGVSAEDARRQTQTADSVDLEVRYGRALRDRMEKTAEDAAYWERWAKIHEAGELASKAVLAGAKTGMLVVAGPAGYIPAAMGAGVG